MLVDVSFCFSCFFIPPLRVFCPVFSGQVWAIGTGLTATPADAQGVHAYVRSLLAEKYGDAVANGVRIQYGEREVDGDGSGGDGGSRHLYRIDELFSGIIHAYRGVNFVAHVWFQCDTMV